MKIFFLNLEKKGYSGRALIAGTFMTVFFELGLHQLMLKDFSWCRILLAYHLYRDPINGKGHSGDLDIVLPSILLGILIALVGCRWSAKRIISYVFLSAICLVALLPVYTRILGKDFAWWWPNTGLEVMSFLIPEFFKAFLLIGLFTYGIRKIYFADENSPA